MRKGVPQTVGMQLDDSRGIQPCGGVLQLAGNPRCRNFGEWRPSRMSNPNFHDTSTVMVSWCADTHRRQENPTRHRTVDGRAAEETRA